jgi:hypothetical protein
MFHHSAAGATITGTAAASGSGPLSRIGDSKLGRLLTLSVSTGDAFLAWDGGASHPGLTRLLIPAGHNLLTSVTTCELRSSASAIVSATGGTIRHSFSPTAGQIDRTFTAITDRYLALSLRTLLGTAPRLGEVFVTEIRTPQRGPRAPWLDTPVGSVIRSESRERDLHHHMVGPRLRTIDWEFERVELVTSELTLFRDLATAALQGIIYVDPPTDDAAPEAPFAAWAEVRVEQVSTRPGSTGLAYNARVVLLEAQ